MVFRKEGKEFFEGRGKPHGRRRGFEDLESSDHPIDVFHEIHGN